MKKKTTIKTLVMSLDEIVLIPFALFILGMIIIGYVKFKDINKLTGPDWANITETITK